VTQQADIDWGLFPSLAWIRCTGKGNFLASPMVKECAERAMSGGEIHVVVDLEACSGMDSTFMGMLAGLAIKLAKQSTGQLLQIAGASERNVQSLEDLGLDALMEINPEAAEWQGQVNQIRANLVAWRGHDVVAKERSQIVLEAHQILSATSEENARRFETVVQMLEKDLGSQAP
jgi:anti-anti-sigma regulatory factor